MATCAMPIRYLQRAVAATPRSPRIPTTAAGILGVGRLGQVAANTADVPVVRVDNPGSAAEAHAARTADAD